MKLSDFIEALDKVKRINPNVILSCKKRTDLTDLSYPIDSIRVYATPSDIKVSLTRTMYKGRHMDIDSIINILKDISDLDESKQATIYIEKPFRKIYSIYDPNRIGYFAKYDKNIFIIIGGSRHII